MYSLFRNEILKEIIGRRYGLPAPLLLFPLDAGRLKTRGWKTREHQKWRGGNRGSGNRVTRRQGWKTREKRVWKAKIPVL